MELSLPRMYLLRAMYVLVVIGLGITLWPGIISHTKPWSLNGSVVNYMLAAFSLLCLLGIRYPLQMLPVLLWELVWKTLWLSLYVYPLWAKGTLDEATSASAFECLFVVVVYLTIPWDYVYRRYVKNAGERWRNA